VYVCIHECEARKNYSTTSPNKFTAYKTIASLPCTVSCPGKGCYFRFHHSGTRHSNPISVRVLLICKSWTNWGTVIEVNACRYVRMFVCISPAASLSVLLHDTVAGLEDIGILGQLHTYIHTYIHRVLVSGGTNRLPWHHIHLPLSSRTRPCLAIRISHVNAARRSANLTYTYIHIHIPADRNDYSPQVLMGMDHVTSMYMYIKIDMCMYVRMYVCIYICVWKYLFGIVLKDIRMLLVHVCLYVCMYVCKIVYI